MRSRDPAVLMAAARAGDWGALGRLLSLVDRGGQAGRAVGRLAFPSSSRVEQVVGITGAPGAGKSTLTGRLIGQARAAGRTVGVLAVDPSSPFSGGAVLGDRIRMQDHATDPGVFIRSLASRGHLGGLSLAVPEAVRLLGAVGIALVLVETVGVGQVEVEVAGQADTTVVVVNPGWGDTVQAAKAGLLEVADVFVINKADRPGVAETRRDLEQMLELATDTDGWRPPILAASASDGRGVEEVWAAIGQHRDHLVSDNLLAARRGRRLVDELADIVARRVQEDVQSRAGWGEIVAEVRGGRLDPYAGADRLLGGDG